MQSRTSEDTTNRIVVALRVVFVGIRILNLSLKSAPQKNDLTRVCLRSHNSAKKKRNRRFSWSYTIWDMSVDVPGEHAPAYGIFAPALYYILPHALPKRSRRIGNHILAPPTQLSPLRPGAIELPLLPLQAPLCYWTVSSGGKTREIGVCVVYSHEFCHNKTVNSKNS